MGSGYCSFRERDRRVRNNKSRREQKCESFAPPARMDARALRSRSKIPRWFRSPIGNACIVGDYDAIIHWKRHHCLDVLRDYGPTRGGGLPESGGARVAAHCVRSQPELRDGGGGEKKALNDHECRGLLT